MTVLVSATVVLSDDPQYVEGQQYDILLTTPTTPPPARIITGTVSDPPAPATVTAAISDASPVDGGQ